MRIAAEMEELWAMTRSSSTSLGNVIGWMGEGDKIIAIDSHIDTVGIGNRDNWEADPYQGYETDDIIYGRGGSDQEGGMASAAYGAKIMKDLGLIPAGYKIMVVGSVQEEDCDGMCWQSIVNEYFNGPGGRPQQDRVRHLHRAHRRRHLPWPPGPHGDPGGRARVSPATAPPRSGATTPSTRWPTSSRTSGTSTKIAAGHSDGDQGPGEDAGSRSTIPSTARTPGSWAGAPAPPARSSTPLPPAAPWPTAAPSPSTAA